jgi:tRNA A-37 threonylcarbamoyl transferase component Bud32
MSAADPTIRGYRVLRLLGEGGMGRVYLAEDETLQRRVAIKMISPRLAGKGAAHARFLREARAMAGVEHANIVRIYGFGEAEGQAYFVMEYVEGETLSTRLDRAVRLTVAEALRIARESAQALAAAWRRGIVHRDVKPSNILLDGEDHVKVADFGLARLAGAASEDSSQTGAGTVLGTPHYMAPEQARGEPGDFRSDIYSLGVVLYEMLGGQKPFVGGSPVEVIAKHLSEPLPPLRERCPEVQPGVVDLVEWMTAKSAGARPSSYENLLSHLLPETASGPAVSDSASFTMTSPSPVARDGARRKGAARRRARVLWGVVGALLAGLALLLWFHPWHARHGAFAVAVAPFYGPDTESEREGRIMSSLVESALLRRLSGGDIEVLGIDETKRPVRSARLAKALAERLEADAVVWGEAFAVQGEVEFVPHITRRDGTSLDDDASPAPMPSAQGIAGRRARAEAVAKQAAALYTRN